MLGNNMKNKVIPKPNFETESDFFAFLDDTNSSIQEISNNSNKKPKNLE